MDVTAEFSGKKLRTLRLAQGLTQAELAHRAHVRERQIIRWENGQNSPRVESISALARVLKCKVGDLLTSDAADEDDEESDPLAVLVNAIKVFVRAEIRTAATEGGDPG